MTKRETIKFIVQMIASIATAIVTALGATSCMGVYCKYRNGDCNGPWRHIVHGSVVLGSYAVAQPIARSN